MIKRSRLTIVDLIPLPMYEDHVVRQRVVVLDNVGQVHTRFSALID